MSVVLTSAQLLQLHADIREGHERLEYLAARMGIEGPVSPELADMLEDCIVAFSRKPRFTLELHNAILRGDR